MEEMKKTIVRITAEDIKFLAANFSKMTMEELMAETELSELQINNAMGALRKNLRDRATTDEEKEAVEKVIKERFTRVRVFGPRTSEKKSAIDSVVDGIFGEL